MASHVAIYSKYRADVDEFEKVTVHEAHRGVTLCGIELGRVKNFEVTYHTPDCERCLSIIRKSNPL